MWFRSSDGSETVGRGGNVQQEDTRRSAGWLPPETGLSGVLYVPQLLEKWKLAWFACLKAVWYCQCAAFCTVWLFLRLLQLEHTVSWFSTSDLASVQAESVIRSVPYPHTLPPQPLAPSGGSDAEHHVELLTQLSTLDRLQFETAQARPTQLLT